MGLVRRLIQGEESHAILFDDILRGYHFIGSLTDHELLRDAELLLAVRLLSLLGYWGEEEVLSPVLLQKSFAVEDLSFVRPERAALSRRVNEALHSSQL